MPKAASNPARGSLRMAHAAVAPIFARQKGRRSRERRTHRVSRRLLLPGQQTASATGGESGSSTERWRRAVFVIAGEEHIATMRSLYGISGVSARNRRLLTSLFINRGERFVWAL